MALSTTLVALMAACKQIEANAKVAAGWSESRACAAATCRLTRPKNQQSARAQKRKKILSEKRHESPKNRDICQKMGNIFWFCL